MIIITKIMEKPVQSFIIILFATMLIQITCTSLPFEIIIPGTEDFLPSFIAGAVTAILFIYIFKIKKFFSISNLKLGLILVCPDLLMIIINIINPGFTINVSPMVLISTILAGLAIGFSEEIMFRGIVVSYLMKVFRNSKSILIIVIVSALTFGIMHSLNAIIGDPLEDTLLQVFYCFATGILYAAVYLRTGNLWPTIILHSIGDITGFLCTGVVNDGFLATINTLIIICSIISIAIGLYYVRPSKHEEILKIWDEKWAN